MKASNWLGRLFGRGWVEPPATELPPENPGTKLERVLGYSFARPELLETALTHPSAAVGSDVHYERLEFLRQSGAPNLALGCYLTADDKVGGRA